MSFQTAKKREAGGILNREETRNYFYVLMSFLNRELRECHESCKRIMNYKLLIMN